MPIPGIAQPELLTVDHGLRLRKFDHQYGFALSWYQDPETTRLVDGEASPYSPERLKRMYEYLDARGELYFIEIRDDDQWVPIGDVTFWQNDMPIVIGDPARRGKGIGGKVIRTLVKRAGQLGYEKLEVGEIYDFNPGSRRCFEAAGFRATAKTEKGWHYELNL